MKCQRCGNDIPDGELFCAKCGTEVQLVPDYNTVDHLIQYQKNQEEQLQKEQLKEEQERAKTESQKIQKKEKRKKSKWIFMIVCISVLVLIFLVICLVKFKHDNSYEYQMDAAYSSFAKGDYEAAVSYTDRALCLQPGDYDAQILTVDIYLETGYTNEAAHILKSLILYEPDNEECYRKLIEIYESQGKMEKIKILMDSCTSPEILETFSMYICENPSFITAEGIYKRTITVEISAKDGTIYYTTDGTIPTSESAVYDGGILLGEGKTTVMAIVYNEKGVSSDIISRDFTVVMERPDSPQIVPASGTYEYGSKITVVVPEGCKAYYTFDGTADASGKLYEEPVTMLNGEHIFSVILIDENGKQSYPASQTYIVE